MGILRSEISMVRAMCGVQLKDGRRVKDLTLIFSFDGAVDHLKDLVLMLGLNEIMDQLFISSSVCWYGHVLRRALDFEVEGQRRKEE